MAAKESRLKKTLSTIAAGAAGVAVAVTMAVAVPPKTPPVNVSAPQPIVAEIPAAPAAERPIKELLKGKSASERANIKAERIASRRIEGRQKAGRFDVEIRGLHAIEGGIEYYARAWDEHGNQLGFGADGSVEFERFQVFNPPVMVPDGTKKTIRNQHGDLHDRDNFREDVQASVLADLAHTLTVVPKKHGAKWIKSGTFGNTTSTFYPDSTESTSQDGWAQHLTGGLGTGVAWGTLVGAAGTSADNSDADVDFVDIVSDNSSNLWRLIRRLVLEFDTSALPDSDEITAATMSVRGTQKSGTDEFTMVAGVYTSNPASNITLAGSDYATFGTTAQSNTTFTIAAWSTAGFNDFPLNATGIGNIPKTAGGIAKFGLRDVNHDVANSAPSWADSAARYFGGYLAEQDGATTTNDPKLVVTHSASGPAASRRSIIIN